MRLRMCKKCGKVFASPTGTVGKYLCDECALQSRRDSVYRERICKICGTAFMGYPRSFFCPECSKERKKSASKIYKRQGPSRPIGSVDICESCGKEYIVKSGRQKYCPDCAEEQVPKTIRAHKRKYMEENKERAQELKNETRGKRFVCVICGKEFEKHTSEITCSPECQKKQDRIRQNNVLIRAEKRKTPANERYISKVPQSGIVGVTYHNGKWQASYKGKYLGVYPTIELASEAIEQYKLKITGG